MGWHPTIEKTDKIPSTVRLRLSSDPDFIAEQTLLSPREERLAIVLIIGVISFFEIRTLDVLHAHALQMGVLGARHMLEGYPEFRVWQNRILGPVLVTIVRTLFRQTYVTSYQLTLSILFALSNFVVYYLTLRATKSSSVGLMATSTFVFLVIILQDKLYFYLWDAIELTVMTVLAYSVFHARGNLWILVPLFLVELLNRESAGFVALWLVLNSFVPIITIGRHAVSSTKMIQGSLGFVMMGVTAGWTLWIRDVLYKANYTHKTNIPEIRAGNGEWLELSTNLKNFTGTDKPSDFTVGLVCTLAIIFLCYAIYRTLKAESFSVIILVLAMLSSVWIFGLVEETRVWLDFIPFVIMFGFTIKCAFRLTRT